MQPSRASGVMLRPRRVTADGVERLQNPLSSIVMCDVTCAGTVIVWRTFIRAGSARVDS